MGVFIDLYDLLTEITKESDDLADIVRDVIDGVHGIEMKEYKPIEELRKRAKEFFANPSPRYASLTLSAHAFTTLRVENDMHFIDVKFAPSCLYLFFRLLGYRVAAPPDLVIATEGTMKVQVIFGWKDGETVRNLYIPVVW